MFRTFAIQTLGCKVNQYESDQIATLLRQRGLRQVEWGAAGLRVVNTCSVTTEAASKSRTLTRQATRRGGLDSDRISDARPRRFPLGVLKEESDLNNNLPLRLTRQGWNGARVIVVGCWATSDQEAALALPGVDAVITHHDDIAAELEALLLKWDRESAHAMDGMFPGDPPSTGLIGACSLPLLDSHQSVRQRAFLKIQDGCDAHCTYCIIPNLRRALWSKPIEEAVAEAQRLVDAGHREIVLTGIFLSAFGRTTALQRRRPTETISPLARLIDALCSRVNGLSRLRLSSLEPGDLDLGFLSALRSHEAVVPHFHLPLQSGSDRLLRRMNRQYRRDQFLRMIDAVGVAFDRPAFTTDIIVGFPGEEDDDFAQTLAVVERARFIHVHAFAFSPRPGTAAARWKRQAVNGAIITQRLKRLRERAAAHSFSFRSNWIGQTVNVLVERRSPHLPSINHGRCERYFDVEFGGSDAIAGQELAVRIDRVLGERTLGSPLA